MQTKIDGLLHFLAKSTPSLCSVISANTSILELIIAKSAEETNTTHRIIHEVIESGSSHSLFTGLLSRRGEKGEEMNEGGVGFVRCLLHFTPVKNGQVGVIPYSPQIFG